MLGKNLEVFWKSVVAGLFFSTVSIWTVLFGLMIFAAPIVFWGLVLRELI